MSESERNQILAILQPLAERTARMEERQDSMSADIAEMKADAKRANLSARISVTESRLDRIENWVKILAGAVLTALLGFAVSIINKIIHIGGNP